jgi:hypothetical protein
VSVDADNLFEGGVTIFVCTSSETSSSISVVSVPFDVTGEGPTISNGLFMPAPLREEAPSIELGRRLEEPAELCADLQELSVGGEKTERPSITYKEENRGELVRPGELEFED